jgi:hypothetical protein
MHGAKVIILPGCREVMVGWHCACRKLHPAIFVVEPTENRPYDDLAEPLDRPMQRRIFVQGRVRPDVIIVGSVCHEVPVQMGLAGDDDVIEALPADRADQSLRMPILPG